ncbi:MAG: hypothetical protein JRN06_07415 [Nitrososphaerota archaeon]|nr:hypothetical protein [Nitrososphaerota archaeon]MDG7024390.1 hypothetical protein [Nitrososphaerota archaeon]
MKRRYVFDATPLIHLSKAGLARLIEALDGEKFTVPTVVNEVAGKPEGKGREYPDAVIISSLIEKGTIRVRTPAPSGAKSVARIHRDIHAGEAEAIALAKEVRAVAVVDDRAARAAARIQGVRVEGTYGVVLRAVKKGALSVEEGEDALGRLVSSGWRCDAELYGALLKSLRKTRPAADH